MACYLLEIGFLKYVYKNHYIIIVRANDNDIGYWMDSLKESLIDTKQ